MLFTVYAISSLDTGSSLRRDTQTAWGAVGTHQGVAGLAPRPFSSEEETGSQHGCGHVHRTRMLICMHNWGSSLHLPPHRRSSIIVIGARARTRTSPPCFRVTHGALAAPAPWCGALGSPCTCTEVHPGRLAPRCTVHLGASGLLGTLVVL